MSTTAKKEHDPLEQFVGCLGLLIVIPLASAWGAFVGGYTLSTLWAWFVVPAFGAPLLGKALAAGLMLIPWYFLMMNRTVTPDGDSLLETLGKSLRRMLVVGIAAGLLLLEGYVIHHWFA